MAKLTIDLSSYHFNTAFILLYAADLLYFDLRLSVMFCVCGFSQWTTEITVCDHCFSSSSTLAQPVFPLSSYNTSL